MRITITKRRLERGTVRDRADHSECDAAEAAVEWRAETFSTSSDWKSVVVLHSAPA